MFFFAVRLNAQEANIQGNRKPKYNSTLGTYQIQNSNNSRYIPAVPKNIDEIVTIHRKENEVVYYKLDQNFVIVILPISDITKSDFKPISQFKRINKNVE